MPTATLASVRQHAGTFIAGISARNSKAKITLWHNDMNLTKEKNDGAKTVKKILTDGDIVTVTFEL
jgi:hypothetical protein